MSWINPKEYNTEQRKKSHELIRRGHIRHLLTPVQRKMLDLIESDKDEAAYYCTRKIGKSFSLILIECAECIKRKGIIWRHMFPTLKLAKEVVAPIYNELIDIFPDDVLPTYLKSEVAFEFNNGSKLIFGGCHPDNINSSRGPIAHGLTLDEAASFEESNFDYALYSVLFPQTTTTGGKIFHATTPPENPLHPWLTKILPRLKRLNCTIEATIYENPLLTPKMIQQIIDRYGGEDNPNFQREYLLKPIAITDRRVVPEFNKELHTYSGELFGPMQSQIVKGMKTDCIGFVSLDSGLGKTDFTSVLAGFLDWTTSTLFICKEIVLTKLTTISDIAAAYSEMRAFIEPEVTELVSIGDMFEQIRISLRDEYGLTLNRPIKFDLVGSVGKFRNCVDKDRVKIHESCTNLITQCEMALWKQSESDTKKIEHSETAGHNDALMAAIYMVRYINDFTRRPKSPNMKNTMGLALQKRSN